MLWKTVGFVLEGSGNTRANQAHTGMLEKVSGHFKAYRYIVKAVAVMKKSCD